MARKVKRERGRSTPSIPDSRPPVQPDEAPLRVFVSSAIRGLEVERRAVRDAINRLEPFTRAWIFEETPASDEDVDEYYLERVRSSALFVLLIDAQDREAVRREYQAARDAKVPVLAFVRSTNRSEQFRAWVDSVRSKRADYDNVAQLPDLVYVSVADWILRHLRSAIQRGQEENLLQSVVPEMPPSQLRQIMNGLIVGLENNADLIPIFQLCGGVPLVPSEADDISFDDIYFDDLAEMTEVMAALGQVINRAASAPDGSREFYRALNEEAARQATQYGLRKIGRRKMPDRKVIPGIRYTIMPIRHDWAEVIRLLRVRDIVDDPVAEVRDGTELYFRYPEVFQHLGQFIEAAQKNDPDDPWLEVLEQVNVLTARLQADEMIIAEAARQGAISHEPLVTPIGLSDTTAARLLDAAYDRLQAARALNDSPRDLKIRALAIASGLEAAAEAKARFHPEYRPGFRQQAVQDSCVRVRSDLDDVSDNWAKAVEDLGHALARLLGDDSIERRAIASPRTEEGARMAVMDMFVTLETWLDSTRENVKFNDMVEGE